MATNESILIAGLRNYHECLRRQTGAIDGAHAALKERFRHLWNVYEGRNAERFQAHWRKTSASIDACLETSRRLDRFLEERIVAVEEIERRMQL